MRRFLLEDNTVPYGYEDINLDMYNTIAAEIDKLFNQLIQIVYTAKEYKPSGWRGWISGLMGPDTENPYFKEQFLPSRSLEVYTEGTKIMSNLVSFVNENTTPVLSTRLIPALKQARDQIKDLIKKVLFNPRKNKPLWFIDDEQKKNLDAWVNAWKMARENLKKKYPDKPTPPSVSEPEEIEDEDLSVSTGSTKPLPSPTSPLTSPSPSTSPISKPEEPEDTVSEPEASEDDEYDTGHRDSTGVPATPGHVMGQDVDLSQLVKDDNSYYLVGALAHSYAKFADIFGLPQKNLDDINLNDLNVLFNKLGGDYSQFIPDKSVSNYPELISLGKKLLGEEISTKPKRKGEGEAEEKRKGAGRQKTSASQMLNIIFKQNVNIADVNKAIRLFSTRIKDENVTFIDLMEMFFDKIKELVSEDAANVIINDIKDYTFYKKHEKSKPGKDSLNTFIDKIYNKYLKIYLNPIELSTTETVNYYKNLLKNNYSKPKLLLKESHYLRSLKNNYDKIEFLLNKLRN